MPPAAAVSEKVLLALADYRKVKAGAMSAAAWMVRHAEHALTDALRLEEELAIQRITLGEVTLAYVVGQVFANTIDEVVRQFDLGNLSERDVVHEVRKATAVRRKVPVEMEDGTKVVDELTESEEHRRFEELAKKALGDEGFERMMKGGAN